MKPKRVSKKDALKIAQTFNVDKMSLFLSSVDENAQPFASYSPFVEDEEFNIYIIISDIVPHSHNLNTTKKASIMIIEDESKCDHIYARKRFYGKVQAQKMANDDEKRKKIMDLFKKRFGKEVLIFDTMSDFNIYKLILQDANLVLGFGSAFSISPNRKEIYQKSIGHKK